MCKQPSTLQTTQNTTQSVPGYVSDAQQALLGYGSSMLGNFLSQTPNYRVAGNNADQQQTYDLARQTAQNAYTTGLAPTVDPSGYQATLYGPESVGGGASYAANSVGPGASYAASSVGQGASYDPSTVGAASTVNGAGIQALMNPYTQSVIDPTLANMRRQSDISAAQIGAQGAAAGSFGGSRDAIRQAQNTRALGEQTAQIVPQLYSQSYGQAASLAQANAAAQNSAAQYDAAARNAAAQFGASSDYAARATDASARNAAAQFAASSDYAARATDAAARNTAAQFGATSDYNARATDAANTTAANASNAGALNAAAQYNSNRNLTAAQMQSSLQDAQQARQLAAANFLRTIGGDQQTQLQNILNVPLSSLAAYQSIVPSQIPVNSSSVGTQPNTAQNPLMQLLGLGLTYAGSSGGSAALGSLFACDARLKKNIAPYGTDARGRPLFTFHYAWEDDDAPLTVGPMAQIEEEHDPESVVEALGIKLVRVH